MNGRDAIDSAAASRRRALNGGGRATLITGGAGFVGANLAHRLLSEGQRVLVFDNLSRPGVERNLAWLQQTHPHGLDVMVADVRDADAVERAVARADHVFHFAAQVAVTTSLDDPREDFAVNALGTLNVLEAARAQPVPPSLVMTSTNKVYGGLDDVALELDGQRYGPADADIAAHGIAETRPLDFHSPYGCSKGTADQYVRDYARSYGLRTVVFRMSCIYGWRQFGTEDQGWVAHFLLRALAGEPITLFGDGRQVRDILFVDDLVDAFLRARRGIDALAGRVFNIGGGPGNVVSLLELIDMIGALEGHRPETAHEGWRTGDQRYYVSDTRAFQAATGWRPAVDARQGVERLHGWLREMRAQPVPQAALRQPASRRPTLAVTGR
ncbi:NAD-dependent epimerase/dehydratase family protein [Variovorax paradoxus]|uniref:NAD-dependent epimerase/dehydratase n=1 Tax=Variovorax paradoxus (strain EPS) TaxID=595537 RepID=E6V7Y1_VARPE|nr:NAD-dependent epimerase/dehydratase family protein [Variovorax paradoxus]ADU37242.1 NAD-dependent epimerase/dehydratase [Variovorax paradoxus EPS]